MGLNVGARLKYIRGLLRRGVPVSAKILDCNLLVSCSWGAYRRAREEIRQFLGMLGDENPVIQTSGARGIIGVRTSIDSREIVCALRRLFARDPLLFQYALKWVPIDLWTLSDMESMKAAAKKLSSRITGGEKWRMTVEKRRHPRYHKIEIITELAKLIEAKVDLDNPDKILRVDIIGKYAGLAVLRPSDVFSVAKPLEEIESD